MDLNQVRYFLAFAESLSFTKAAAKCGVTQPTMSRAIKLLEQEFGAELVRRERGRTHLTELGRLARPRLELALAQVESVQADAIDFATMTRVTLRLGVMCTISPTRLIPIISKLTVRAPELGIELVAATGEKIVEMLIQGSLDVALVGIPKYPEVISTSPLYEEQYVVAFSRGHRFEKMDTVPVRELQDEPYLERLNWEYVLHYNDCNPEFSVDLDIRYRSENEEWIQAMVLAGMGCCCMPESMSLNPELLRRPLIEPTVKRQIVVATVRGRKHTPAIDLFSRLCMEFHCSQK